MTFGKVGNDAYASHPGQPGIAKLDTTEFGEMIKAFFDKGAAHVQFTILDRETLIDAKKNPENYRNLVVRVAGSVPAGGDSASVWMAGWSEDGAVRGAAVTGTSSAGHTAGDRVTLTGASGPLSFKEDRNLQPVLMFLGSNNQQIDSVRLEVWSGIGKASFTERLWAWLPLLTGLVFLGVFFWFRRN